MPRSAAWSRREFVRTAALSPFALPVPRSPSRSDINCILLMLVGGPSQLDTWDPKPDAPAEIRGPFRWIATRAPGVRLTELFPRMAQLSDKFSMVRSMHHTAPAVHDAGHQLMQTGHFASAGIEHPHVGAVLSSVMGGRGSRPAHVLIPGPIGETGGGMAHGQSAGWLGAEHEPVCVQSMSELDRESPASRERYGRTRFGESCLLARRLVERGVRFVTVNMFDTVYDAVTWDTHGWKPFTSIRQMADRVAPDFDRAYAALLSDLHERGLSDTTIVCAFGEFGRSPRMNHAGGRDHHPGVWTVLIGGGPIRGGRVVGASDRQGCSVADRPVTPAEIVATLYRGLGVDPSPFLDRGAEPIAELF